MPTAPAAIDRLTDPVAKVSAHYVVVEDGEVFILVAEKDRAWHAGKSFWRSITDVNSASIGIEIVNPGHEFGYRPFPEPQMATVESLVRDIAERHAISPAMIVGHSDIAPLRKIDPGELFDWPRLAAAGLALPIPEVGLDPDWTEAGFLAALSRFGYDVSAPVAAVSAFQRRFRPRNFSGVIDAESRALLFALLR